MSSVSWADLNRLSFLLYKMFTLSIFRETCGTTLYIRLAVVEPRHKAYGYITAYNDYYTVDYFDDKL